MRLVFINRYFHPDLSGAAQMLTQLAEDLDARGLEVTVITSRTAYTGGILSLSKSGGHKGIHVIRVPSTSLGRGGAWVRVIDYASFYLSALWSALHLKGQDALVVLSDPPLLSALAVLVGAVKKVRTYCWMHDVYPDIAIRARIVREGLIAGALGLIARWSLRRIGGLVVLGHCMEQHLLKARIPSHKIRVIPNWADGMQIQPIHRADNQFLERHGLRERFVVMYSGNLGAVHEFTTITEMIRRTQSYADMYFCFVGDGPQKRYLVQTAEQERWQRVLFLPYEAKERLRFSLCAADVHLASLKSEMAGLSVPSKVYGIMAAARPVIFIGPDQSEVSFVIKEAQCGHVIRPGDTNAAVAALKGYYDNRDETEQRGQSARKYFDRYCERAIGTERFFQVLSQNTSTR
jgi:glycosyltransferase involved in cell wall biosynthesis